MKKIKPLGDRVLIKRSTVVTTKNGILLPDTAQKRPMEGEIIAVGEGKITDNGLEPLLDVKVGDNVVFSSYVGTNINVEGACCCDNDDDSEYIVISEKDILGVLSQY